MLKVNYNFNEKDVVICRNRDNTIGTKLSFNLITWIYDFDGSYARNVATKCIKTYLTMCDDIDNAIFIDFAGFEFSLKEAIEIFNVNL